MILNKKNLKDLYPESLAGEIDKNLKLYLNDYKHVPTGLRDAIEYSLLNGGKRLRPVLCLATAKSIGCRIEKVIPTACAIEFIHTYSLIHDDLPAIDNDDLRRGKASCHKKFGEDIAILTGDALFAESFNVILKYQKSSPGKKLEVLHEIISATGASGMVAGQVVDVSSTGKQITKKDLEYMHLNKTSKLIVAAIRTSAIICNANKNILNSLSIYGENIGLVFQITDDILDITSSAGTTGKTHGKDIEYSKNTFPSLWGMEKSKKIAKEKTEKAIDSIKDLDIDKNLLTDIAQFVLFRKA
jgi:geranylgeranyl diphosphate synthase, type II